jgi:hypothetical protein
MRVLAFSLFLLSVNSHGRDFCDASSSLNEIAMFMSKCESKQLSPTPVCYVSSSQGYATLWKVFNSGSECTDNSNFSHNLTFHNLTGSWSAGTTYVCGAYWNGSGSLTLNLTGDPGFMTLSGSSACAGSEVEQVNSACGMNPLPVTLVNFSASLNVKNRCVDLKFKTASENNSDRVIIEHSRDGKSFDPIQGAEIKSKYPNGGDYKYSDCSSKTAGTHYYRLKQIDFDGKSEYHKVVAVSIDKATVKTVLYPNPTVDEINVEMDTSGRDFVYVQVFDVSGKLVIKKKVSVQGNVPGFTTDVRHLASAMYIMRILGSDEKEIHTGKFIKLK